MNPIISQIYEEMGISRRPPPALAQIPEMPSPSILDIGKTVGLSALDAFNTLLAPVMAPGEFVRNLAVGDLKNAALSQIPFHNRLFNLKVPSTSGRDVLEKWGVLGKNKPGADWGDLAGFIADIGLDPLTYLGPGILGRTAKGAEGLRTSKLLGEINTLKNVRKPIDAAGLTGDRLLLAANAEIDDIAGTLKKVVGKRATETGLSDTLVPGAKLTLAELGKTDTALGSLIAGMNERAILKLKIPWGPQFEFGKFNKEFLTPEWIRKPLRAFNFLPSGAKQAAYDVSKRLEGTVMQEEAKIIGGLRDQYKKILGVDELTEGQMNDAANYMEYAGEPRSQGRKEVIRTLGEFAKRIKKGLTTKEIKNLPKAMQNLLWENDTLSAAYEAMRLRPTRESIAAFESQMGHTKYFVAQQEKLVQELTSRLPHGNRAILGHLAAMTEENLARNIALGAPERVYESRLLSYVHHHMSPQGRDWMDQLKELEQHNFNGQINSFGTRIAGMREREVSQAITKLNASAKKAGYTGDQPFFFNDPFLASAARARTSAFAGMKHVYIKTLFDMFGEEATDPNKIYSLGAMLKNSGYKKWNDTNFVVSHMSTITRALKEAGIPESYGIDRELWKDAMKPYEILKNQKGFWKDYDNVTGVYRASVTSIWPLHLNRNILGAYWNSGVLGGTRNPARHVQANKIMSSMINSTTDTLDKTNTKFMKEALNSGAVKEIADAVSQQLPWVDDKIKQSFFWNPTTYLKKKIMDKPKRTIFDAMTPGFELNTRVENTFRLAHSIDRRMKGDTITEAAASVRKYMFNYNELSNFERQTMQRAAFFYTWQRKNIPLHFEHLLAPQIRAYAYATGRTDEPVEGTPEWLRSTGAFILGKNPATGGIKSLDLGLPIQDPMQMGKLGRIASSLAPIPKGILEWVTQKDFYSGRDLSEIDKAPPVWKHLFKGAQKLGIETGYRKAESGYERIDPRWNMLFKSTPAVRAYSLPWETEDTGGSIANLLIGKVKETRPKLGKEELYSQQFNEIMQRLEDRGDLYEYPMYWGNTEEAKQLSRYIMRK